MQSTEVHALTQMGIKEMAQKVGMSSSMIAERTALFQNNWECITTDARVKK